MSCVVVMCGLGCCRCREKQMLKVADERKVRRIPKGPHKRWKHFLFLYLLAWGHAEGALGKSSSKKCPLKNLDSINYEPTTLRNASRELHELYARVQRAMATEARRNLDIIETYTVVRQERELWLEIEALSRHRDDGSVTVTMYALQQAHLGTRTRRVGLNRAGGLWHFIHSLRVVWIDLVPEDVLTEFLLVDRQLPPYMTNGEDILHLIFDTQPWRQLIPYVVLSHWQYEGHIDDSNFEIKAARGTRTMPCWEHFDVHGFQELCQRQFVRCRCDEDTNFDVRPDQDTEIFHGKRVNILIEMEQPESSSSDDQMSFMEIPRWPRHQGRYFVYTADNDEPVVVQNFAEILAHLNVHQQVIFQFCEVTGCRNDGSLAVHPLFPQPSDLPAFRAFGFVLVNELTRPSNEHLIVADIDILTNHIPAAVAQRYPRAAWREAKFVKSPQNRREFLILLGLQQFCLGPDDRCIVKHRGLTWASNDRSVKRFLDGDFVHIQVLRRNNEVPFHLQWSWAQDGCDFDGFSHRWAIHNEQGQQDQTDDVTENDTSSVISSSPRHLGSFRSSDAAEGMSRLPPPGNGRSVKFSEVVDTLNPNGLKVQFADRTIRNDFIAKMHENGKDLAKTNEFMKSFLDGLRFEKIDQIESQVKDNGLKQGEEQTEEADGDQTSGSDPAAASLPIISLADSLGEAFLPCATYGRPNDAKGIDFGEVFALKEWLESHQVIPEFAVETIKWKRESLGWVHLPLWQFSAANSLNFYVDGSVGDSRLGAACILFVQDSHGWKFGGYIRHSFPGEGTSYDAELMAHLMSIKWCWDLLRLFQFHHFTIPEVNFVFDNMSAGYAAEGKWKANIDHPIFAAVRSLHHVCQTAFNIDIQMWHEKSHAGWAGNEAADVLAGSAIECKSHNAFWMHFFDPRTAKLIQWVWFLLCGDALPFFEGQRWNLPKIEGKINDEVLEGIKPTCETDNGGKCLPWTLEIMSHNVMAVGAGGEEKWKKGPGLVEAFFKQMAIDGVHLFSIQESRLKRPPSSLNKYFYVFHTAPTQDGLGGLLVGFSKKQPLGKNNEGKVIRFHEHDVRLIHGCPFLMILYVKNGLLNFIFITGQAPHSGKDEREVQQWWQNVSNLLPRKFIELPRIFVGDANARVGSIVTQPTGPWQAETENTGGHHFQSFLARESLFVPATFQQYQHGPGWTWCHPRGTKSRLDYAAFSDSWRHFAYRTWVQKDNILNSLQHDHSSVRASVQGWTSGGVFSQDKKCPSMAKLDMNDKDGMSKLEKLITSLPTAPWTQDVHSQVHDLQRDIREGAFAIIREKPKFKKEYLQSDTWDMIQKKKELKRCFFDAKECNTWWRCRAFFSAWKGETQEAEEALASAKKVQLEEAETSWCYRKVSIQAQNLVRRDDEAFFEELVQRFTTYDDANAQKDFWREVRRQNKNTKGKKKTLRAEAVECLRDAWVPHLCQLEHGQVVTAEKLYRDCLDRQNGRSIAQPDLNELPSLLQVELALKNTKAGKAAGPDNISPDVIKNISGGLSTKVWQVAVKCAVWQTEPLQWKGGRLVHIPKPGTPHDKIEGWRGIVLAPTISKRLQSLTRAQMITLLNDKHPRGQLGGYQKKESIFGAHLVRAINRVSYQARVSSATVFLDVRTAYHALIRSLITGVDNSSLTDYHSISQQLRERGLTILAEIHPTMKHGILKNLNASEFLQKTAQEVNEDTWSLLQSTLVRTSKGSRPGSPLADILYMLTMHEAGHLMQAIIDEDPQIKRAAEDLNIDVPVVIWADDICVPLLCHDCSDLLSMIERITKRVTDILSERGLQTNYGKNKSEVVMTPVGCGAKEIRQNLLRNPQEGIDVDKDQGTKIRVQGKYKHLGCLQSSAGDLTNELKYRAAITWSGFREIKAMICRQSYRLKTRLKLAEALLWSRLFHGAGSWGPLRPRQICILEKCYWGVLRAIAGQTYKKLASTGSRPWSNAKLQAMLQVPDVLTRLTSARLLYGRRLWLHGGTSLRQAVECEFVKCSGSWLEALRKDLAWLAHVNGPQWGQNPEDTFLLWEQGKRGWKSFVRRAELRQSLQTGIAFFLNMRGESTQTEICREVKWKCDECQECFESQRALATHRHRKHQIFTREQGIITGSICPCCLKQLWTNGRLKQHIRYKPKQGGNRCAAFIFAYQWDESEGAPAVEIPFVGMKRRDAIQCEGPLNFGAHASHQEYLEAQLQDISALLDSRGLGDPMSFFDETLKNILQDDMFSNEDTWIEKMMTRHENERIPDEKLAVNLLFAGAQHQWPTCEGRELWLCLMHDVMYGSELMTWFDLQLKRAFSERMQDQMTPANTAPRGTERTANETHFQFLEGIKAPDLDLCPKEVADNIFCTEARLSRLFILHGKLTTSWGVPEP